MYLALLALGFYLIASFCLLIYLKNDKAPYKVLGKIILLAAILAHGICLYGWIDTALGQNLSITNCLTFVMWLVAIFLSIFSFLKQPIVLLQVIISFITAISILLVYVVKDTHVVQVGDNLYEFIHVISSFLAFAWFVISGLQALLLAFQQDALKQHKTRSFLLSVPALETMERLLFSMLLLGFIFLCISLISGLIFWEYDFKVLFAGKVSFAVFAWVVFAVLLFGRYHFGWRGHLAIRLTLGGFALLALSYIGSRFLA